MEMIPYQRQDAIEYARHWAHQRNPIFQQAEPEGGDGASFFSQCLLAGGMESNPNRKAGWCCWEDGCSPAFCCSKELSSFLLRNRGPGTFCGRSNLMQGRTRGSCAVMERKRSLSKPDAALYYKRRTAGGSPFV